MRSLTLVLILILTGPFAANACLAQTGAIKLICLDCRDPHEHPEDYANFAFNQVFGPDGWMDPYLADDFFVYNTAGERVYVDLDLQFNGFELFGVKIPLWPTNVIVITIALPNGTILQFLRSVFQTPLPVPSYGGPNDDDGGDSDPSSGGFGDGSDEGDDDPWPDEEPEDPDVEPVGTVGIVDPDENGDFPEWCVEC